MIKATTIIAVKKDGKVAMAGDGQVTFGEVVFKSNAKKIRKIEKYETISLYNRRTRIGNLNAILPSSPNHPTEGYNNDPHGRCGTRI